MTATLFQSPRLALTRRAWSLLLLLALAPLLGLRPNAFHDRSLRAQPELLTLIAQQPSAHVGVIVQKHATDHSVEDLVSQLGGTITQDLHIINAFAADLPTAAVSTLARAAGVRWVSLDAPTKKTAEKTTTTTSTISTTNLKNTYNRTVGADRIWNVAPYLQGQGIGVAVVDSGIADPASGSSLADFGKGSRIVASVKFNASTTTASDKYGHGSHVAGIIGGDGTNSSGAYIGIAPKVNLINVKVSDDLGGGTAADVVAGLQWINDNRVTYNIRVVNISLNSAVPESYNTNPISAAAEILWFNGIVVVVSSGNEGKNAMYPPANDPFVITVGATDDLGTVDLRDDVVAKYSGAGNTDLGAVKPEIVAPGTNMVSSIGSAGTELAKRYPANQVAYGKCACYFRMSGTSMAAPVVTGAVALLLQDEPNLTPDQVKYRLMATAVNSSTKWGYNASKAGAGLLDIPAAINGTTTESANTGIAASQLLWSGSEAVTWNSVNWNSVNWNSVNWNSVNWNSVNWNSVNWNSDFFGQ